MCRVLWPMDYSSEIRPLFFFLVQYVLFYTITKIFETVATVNCLDNLNPNQL